MTPVRSDPTWLARRMRWDSPPESEGPARSRLRVAEADGREEVEPAADLLQHFRGDLLRRALEVEVVEEGARLIDGESR